MSEQLNLNESSRTVEVSLILLGSMVLGYLLWTLILKGLSEAKAKREESLIVSDAIPLVEPFIDASPSPETV